MEKILLDSEINREQVMDRWLDSYGGVGEERKAKDKPYDV